MPLDRASRPGQRHPRFDRLVILIQSFRKALQGLQRTGRRALQPGVKRFRLPLADQGRIVLRQVDRLGNLGLLRAQLGELLCLSLGALRLVSEDEPCRPARRQRLARRLGHRGQGLSRTAVPGGQALSLPQPASRGRDHAIAPSIATLAEVAEQPHGRIATRIPALEEIRLIGGEHTVPEVAATFAPRKGRSPEIALDRAQTQPDLLRNGRGRPPLTVQGPDLRMQRLPAGLALGRTLLRWQGEVVRWHGYGERPIRQGDGLLVHQHIDRVERSALREKHLVQSLPEILEYMKAVRDLCG